MTTSLTTSDRLGTIEEMLASKLTAQLRSHNGQLQSGFVPAVDGANEATAPPLQTPARSPSKTRSFSDSTPQLSPSPNIKSSKKSSKDDHAIELQPKTPRRPEFLARGLSLQMPDRRTDKASAAGGLRSPGPLSPKLDSRNIYGSPASVLPRHSRGLDFSRACTNLHHSTLAEQSSPDASPTITQKGMPIPQRSSHMANSMILDFPQVNGAQWPIVGHADRTAVSGSVSSINMLESSSSDSDIDDPMEPDENEDIMISTPQAYKLNDASAATPFASSTLGSKQAFWPNQNTPGHQSFMSFHRARMRHRRSRQSSSSASGHSSLASPIPQSPPNGRADVNGYFGREANLKRVASRRESLSIGTNELHISSGNDSGDEAGYSGFSTPGVVQRPVTRRGNLLPKTRAFGRIRAELLEESVPVDTESKREAEVIKQVRESDMDVAQPGQGDDSSPLLIPTAMDGADLLSGEHLPNADGAGPPKGLFGAFSRQAFKNSLTGGKEFWNNFDNQYRTPPPPLFARKSSSALSDDMPMDSPTTTSSTPPTTLFSTSAPQIQDQSHKDTLQSRSSTPQPLPPPSAAEGIRKRRRDDDLDGYSIKRRAVSPGVSVQNSPILSQSPGQRDGSLWGQAPPKVSRESSGGGHVSGERANSNGSTASVVPVAGSAAKRVGMQGMTDTNDGLMKMSIE